MSQFLETLLDFGQTAESLRRVVRECADRMMTPGEVCRELSLRSRQLFELRRLVLIEPDCVERAAMEIGIPLQTLDRAKAALLRSLEGDREPAGF